MGPSPSFYWNLVRATLTLAPAVAFYMLCLMAYIIAFWHIKSWSLLATMLQTDPGCQPGPRPRVGILEFCAPPQILKTIFKELDSDFSDAIKLM